MDPQFLKWQKAASPDQNQNQKSFNVPQTGKYVCLIFKHFKIKAPEDDFIINSKIYSQKME